jgi:hypothetical protein
MFSIDRNLHLEEGPWKADPNASGGTMGYGDCGCIKYGSVSCDHNAVMNVKPRVRKPCYDVRDPDFGGNEYQWR